MKINRNAMAIVLGRLADVMPRVSGLMLSKWVHASLDVLRMMPLQNLADEIEVPDGTGWKLVYTCPENSIVEILGASAIQTAGTWQAEAFAIKCKGAAGYVRLYDAPPATELFFVPLYAAGSVMSTGDELYVRVTTDTAGTGVCSVLGRLFRG